MSLLWLGIRAARDRRHLKKSKKQLEAKLGRKVSENELYSLGANLAATDNQASLTAPYAQPWDSKPKVSSKTKKIILLSLVVLFLMSLPILWIMNMSEHQWNKINPFTPKPPVGSFPATIGPFRQSYEVSYVRGSNRGEGKYFYAYYKTGSNPSIEYVMWSFPNADDARKAFDQDKSVADSIGESRKTSGGDSRFFSVNPRGYGIAYWLNGSVLHKISSNNAREVIDFEAALTNQNPYSKDGVPEPLTTQAPIIEAAKLLADYRSNSKAADLKYKGKVFVVSGEVALAEKDKRGEPMFAFMNPEAKSVNEGMVMCYQPSDKEIISNLKKGETVLMQGRVFGALVGNVMLENCTKPK